jgi:hypothetical protein
MQVESPPQRLLTVREAAAELRVSRDWAYAHLPLVRLGDGQAVARLCASGLRMSSGWAGPVDELLAALARAWWWLPAASVASSVAAIG